MVRPASQIDVRVESQATRIEKCSERCAKQARFNTDPQCDTWHRDLDPSSVRAENLCGRQKGPCFPGVQELKVQGVSG